MGLNVAKMVEVQAMGNSLLKRHNLDDWKFQFDNSKRRVGQCRNDAKEIGISLWYLEKTPIDQIRDTILHEIAHALVPTERDHNGKWDHHGPRWQAKCVEIGARPERLAHAEDGFKSAAKPNYKIKCENCGWFVNRYRMKRRNHGSTCPECGTTVTIYKITYKEGGFQ